jgi:hypothetical protein
MDKEVLAVIGKLYLDTFSMASYIETLKARVTELESQLFNSTSQAENSDKITAQYKKN